VKKKRIRGRQVKNKGGEEEDSGRNNKLCTPGTLIRSTA